MCDFWCQANVFILNDVSENVFSKMTAILPQLNVSRKLFRIMGTIDEYMCKYHWNSSIVDNYSIHVPGWLLKWLNLITTPVNNEPGSVTWLATKYLKTVSWRNRTEKLTTLWPQNISFWSKINIPSSYFTILMLNCLENTPKLRFDSYVTAVKLLT